MKLNTTHFDLDFDSLFQESLRVYGAIHALSSSCID